jgi:hypothetical protein
MEEQHADDIHDPILLAARIDAGCAAVTRPASE